MEKFEKLSFLVIGIILFVVFSIFYNTFVVNNLRSFSNILGNISTIIYPVILYYYVTLYHNRVNKLTNSYITFKVRDFYYFFFGVMLNVSIMTFEIIFIKISNLSKVGINDFNANDILTILFSNFAIGIIEEFFFRAFIFVALVVIFKTVWAPLILSSVFFSIIHINGLENLYVELKLVNIFLIGCLLSYIYFQSGSIWSAVGFHSINNILNKFISFPDNPHIFQLGILSYIVAFAFLYQPYYRIFSDSNKPDLRNWVQNNEINKC